MDEPRMIKKYPNRRFYDYRESRYVDLAEIQRLVTEGVEFVVVDKRTGEDITRAVLLQVITCQEQRGVHLLTREFLLQMIRSQARGPRSLTASYLEQSLNLLNRGGYRGANGRDMDNESVQVVQRLARKHYHRWCAVEEEIDLKLKN
jgi:polyhydroxyalkanoate synthesis repressor PhaR